MKDKTLLALVSRASLGDQSAFVELCRLKGKAILYMCRGLMRSPEDAEDAAQEVFVQLQSSIRNLQSPEAFNVWLNRLVFNTCANLRCAMAKHDHPHSLDVLDGAEERKIDFIPQEYIEHEDKRRRVAKIIEDLPDKYRISIQMFYYDEMSYAEIAQVLDTTPKAVGGYLDRARQLLKIKLNADMPSETQATVPMIALDAALYTVMKRSIEEGIPQEAINACIEAITLGAAPAATAATIASVAGNLAPTAASAAASAAGSAATTAAATSAAAAGGFTALKIVVAAVAVPGIIAAGYSAQQFLPTASQPTSIVSSQLEWPPQPFESDVAVDMGYEDITSPAGQIKSAGRCALSGRISLDKSAVVDKAAQDGLGGIRLELFTAENTLAASTQTSQDGGFTLEGLAEGKYKMRLWLPAEARVVGGGLSLQADETQAGAYWLMDGGGRHVLQVGEDGGGLSLCVQWPAAIKGRILAGTESTGKIPQIEVSLINAEGNTLMVAKTDSRGNYVFNNPMIRSAGSYTLRYTLLNQMGWRLASEEVPIRLTPGKNYEVPAQKVLDISPPTLTIELGGGSCTCGHENPSEVSILVWDASDVNVEWKILRYDDKQIVARAGKQTPAEAVRALPSGNYLLVATATDKTGNTTETQQLISIYR